MASPVKSLAILAGIGAVLFLALQCVRPGLPNPPVLADLQAPAPVKQILKNSCYACHSNETQLPWFDRVVPAYWLVVRDVRHGRRHLNFSDFGQMAPAKQKGFLYEAVNQIQLGAMPPKDYEAIHPDSIVTPEQLAVLKDYLHPAEPPANPAAESAANSAADAQYNQWIVTDSAPREVKPAPNGLLFFPDYKNWKPISTTDRFDNHTLRVILGNDIAIQAIRENHIHPWPDGAAFAKLAWAQAPDSQGVVRSGEFKQVEFMVKDAKKYADTEGWGWGRWLGTDLAPYGKNQNFARECTSCHAPMEANDFVFTMPIQGQPQP